MFKHVDFHGIVPELLGLNIRVVLNNALITPNTSTNFDSNFMQLNNALNK